MREYTYQIDEDGRIWCDGEWYDAPEIYEAFYRTMTRDPSGKLFATCMGERCWIDAADTPFVVDWVDVDTDSSGNAQRVTLRLMGGVREALDPDSLRVGAANVLYTRVRGEFPARFSHKAYYELARYVAPTGKGFSLLLQGREHPIAGSENR